MLVYFVTTARPAKDTAALYLDSVGFWYTKLISSSIFIASSGSFVQAIITAGRTGFGSPGQVQFVSCGSKKWRGGTKIYPGPNFS